MDRNAFSTNMMQTFTFEQSSDGSNSLRQYPEEYNRGKCFICGFQSKKHKKNNGLAVEKSPNVRWTNKEGVEVNVHRVCHRILTERERYRGKKTHLDQDTLMADNILQDTERKQPEVLSLDPCHIGN